MFDNFDHFDDNPPPTDDLIKMIIHANSSMEEFLGLNESFSLGNSSTSNIDDIFESITSKEDIFLNDSDTFYSPKMSELGQKDTTVFEFYTVGVLLTFVSVFGLVGNIVAIIVLSRPVMKGSFASLLIGKSLKIIECWIACGRIL